MNLPAFSLNQSCARPMPALEPARPAALWGSATRWLAAVLLAYVVGFVAFYPNEIVVTDEAMYVAQSLAFAHGKTTAPTGNWFSPAFAPVSVNHYPPGTALLQTPFVWLAGWHGAAGASLISLLAAVLFLARWLRAGGRSPGWALLLLAYVPVLVLGRVAMSDVPSAAIVCLGFWLFWSGMRRPWTLWFACGFVAAAAMMFRETNALLFAPLFLGALLRRERNSPALVGGGLAGTALWLATQYLLSGSVMLLRNPGYPWRLSAPLENAGLYAFALLLLVPGGLFGLALYRGERRPELITAISLFVLTYLFYSYSAAESGGLKRIVLGLRFFIPLVPVLSFVNAEWMPRLWSRLAARQRIRSSASALVTAYCCGVLVAAFAVHPLMQHWSSVLLSMRQALYTNTTTASAVIGDTALLAKFISPVYGTRVLVNTDWLPAHDVPQILTAHPSTYVVVLDRMDSAYFRHRSQQDDRYLQQLSATCSLSLLHDQWHDPANRLRIWRVVSCREPLPRHNGL